MSSTNFIYSLLYSGSEEREALCLEGRRHFLSSEQFFSLSHSELLWHLRNRVVDVADEHDLFQAIIRWAILKCSDSDDGIAAGRGRIPSIKALKTFIAPPEKEDLMKEIRVALFSKNQWDVVSESQEAFLLPLTMWENNVLKEYLAASTIVKEKMIHAGDLKNFNLHPRAMSTGNDTDTVPDTNENQERSGQPPPPVTETNNSATRRSPSGTITIDDNESNSDKGDQIDGLYQIQNCYQDSSVENDESESTESKQSMGNRMSESSVDSSKTYLVAGKKRPGCLENLSPPSKRTKQYENKMQRVAEWRNKNQSQLVQDEVNDMEVASTVSATNARIQSRVQSTEPEPELPKLEIQPMTTPFAEYVNSLKNITTRRICAEFLVHNHIEDLDLESVEYRKFPKLKEFTIKFTFRQLNPDDLEARFKTFVTRTIHLEKYLCFASPTYDLSNLWKEKVNLSIEFHGCVIIKMNHKDKELVLSSPKNAMAIDILAGVKDVPLKTIALGFCGLTHRLNFEAVEKLILSGVKGTTKFNDILIKCPSLVELSLWKNELKPEPVNLSLIQNPSKLKWLALFGTDISVSRTTKFPNLETLHLQSECSDGFIKAFPTIFPSIKKLSIRLEDRTGGSQMSLKLIVSVLGIRSLCWARVCKVDWDHVNSRGKNRTDLKILTGLDDPMHTSFILTKRGEVDGNLPIWEVELLDENSDIPGGYQDKLNEQDFEFYKLESFCKQFSDTVPAWRTYNHFFPRS